jgi:hypothetical protein
VQTAIATEQKKYLRDIVFEGDDTRLAGSAQPKDARAERAKTSLSAARSSKPFWDYCQGGTPLNAGKVHGDRLTHDAGGIGNQ